MTFCKHPCSKREGRWNRFRKGISKTPELLKWTQPREGCSRQAHRTISAWTDTGSILAGKPPQNICAVKEAQKTYIPAGKGMHRPSR